MFKIYFLLIFISITCKNKILLCSTATIFSLLKIFRLYLVPLNLLRYIQSSHMNHISPLSIIFTANTWTIYRSSFYFYEAFFNIIKVLLNLKFFIWLDLKFSFGQLNLFAIRKFLFNFSICIHYVQSWWCTVLWV